MLSAAKVTRGLPLNQAAKLPGITRATLRKRIEEFGIQREMKIE